jgi:hypothetical protein
MDKERVEPSSQPTRHQLRRAGAYFLIALGTPIAVAFLYPFLPGHGGSLWSQMPHTPKSLAVLLVGGGVGVGLIVVGRIMLWTGQQR